MTQLLEDALRKVDKLPDNEQDAIASQILAMIEDGEAWAKTLRKNPSRLGRLAAEALDEHRRGATRSVDELL
jgi:hypothetical protein